MLAGVDIIRTYGQTETFRTVLSHGDQLGRDASCLGRVVEGVQAVIVDEEGRVCGPGEVGQLVHFGAGVMSGYLHDEALTAGKLIEGRALGLETISAWGVLTGDLFEVDADGGFRYRGRMDGMVKRSGYRVYVEEIERTLAGCAGVSEVAVVAVDGEEGGEKRLVVFVCGGELDEAAVVKYARERLPFYMAPDAVRVVEGFAYTGSGKIDRQRLLEKMA